jgi:outer membrane receptor protein involved in Fe transport
VLDLRLGLTLSSDATLVLRAENVTDVQYAHPLNASDPFTGTPIAEPGRTLGMGLRVAF